MTNSMNSKAGLNEVIEGLKKIVDLEGVAYVQYHEVAIDVSKKDLHQALSFVKNTGFRQLSAVTCVDWLAEGNFQLIFNTFDWSKGIRVILRVKIPRSEPTFTTVTTIYNGAKYYEREVHEFFGIVFEGNPDALKQLFLEQWDDLPPMRKDFDSRAYSDRKYTKREYKTSFGEPGGEPFERN